jgi:DNA-binding CsgD family transcriptional regulator
MGGSQRLRVSDTARLLRIQCELSELPPFTSEWKEHVLKGLVSLVPAQLAFFAEMADFRENAVPKTLGVAAIGWLDEEARLDFHRWITRRDMTKTHPVLDAITRIRKRAYTHRRIELVDDRDWYRSEIVNTMFRVSRVDDNISAVYRIDQHGTMVGYGIYRAASDPPFTKRDRVIAHLLLTGIAPRYIREQARLQEVNSLSPRLRQVLNGLISGEGEKQIAFKLGLSRHTVHEYIGELYRRFDISSRAELMLKVLQPYRPNASGEQPAETGATPRRGMPNGADNPR